MMMEWFIPLSGVVNAASGVLLLAFWFLYAALLPYSQLSTSLSILVRNRRWTPVNLLGVSGALLGLLGQAGILVSQSEGVGSLGVVGFFVASAGTALLLGPLLWDTVLWPILDAQDSGLLDFQGPIYQSKTFVPFFILAGLLYSIGYILVGIGIVKVGLLPGPGGILLAVGAPLYGLGAAFGRLQVVIRSIGVTLLSAGLIWLGSAMW
jgi:hypothetical protein